MKQIIFKYIILGIILLIPKISCCQYTNNIWCFGDSAGINFKTNPPTAITSGLLTKSGSASITDNFGNILFYGSASDDSIKSSGKDSSGILKNRLNATMQNGTNLYSEWYHVMTIIPKSISDSTFYVFTGGVLHSFGLYYSVVDLKQNTGLGAVVQKNVQLDTFPVFDGITAVKHGNGNDWWLLYQRWDALGSQQNNEFHLLLVDSSGIQMQSLQNIGSLHDNGAGDLSFNSNGTKMIYVEWRGMIELYYFDRFTGIILNPINIEPELSVNPVPYYTSAVFSSNGRILYVTSYQSVYHKASYLYQYDLTAANIAASRILLDSV